MYGLWYIFLMEKIRLYIQSLPINIGSWFVSLLGVMLIRIFFEQISSFNIREPFILIDIPTLIHYILFYLVAALGLVIILIVFAKITTKEALSISIFGSLLIWIPPIIDLIIGGVGGHLMSYLFVPGKELLSRFITFFGEHINSGGVTIGMQIETLIGVIFCYLYTYLVTKKIFKSIGAAIAFYCFIFFILSMPSFLALLLPQTAGPWTLIVQSVTSSHIIQGSINPFFTANDLGLISLAFNKVMIGAWTILGLIFSMFLFFTTAQKKFIAIIKNRPERIIHFYLLFTFGAILSGAVWSTNWIDIQAYILALIASACAWMFSVCQNDIYDEKIDIISNQDRPLVKKILSKNDLEIASRIFLFFALISAYASSNYVFFFTCFIILIYYIYSNPPLRLRRFVFLSSFLISLAFMATILSGFFLMNPTKTITAFPSNLLLAIIIFFTGYMNIRDIKDIDGDRKCGVITIPTLLGLRKSKKLIGGVVSFLFILIPWFLHIPSLIIASIIASLLSWYFITKEKHEEWKCYAVYGIYFLLIIWTIL